MSIYGNGIITKKSVIEKKETTPKEKLRPSHKNSEQTKAASTKDIRNDKDLTALVKEFDSSIGGVKEIIFDHNKSIIGLLKRSGEPHFFSEKESKEFSTHIGT